MLALQAKLQVERAEVTDLDDRQRVRLAIAALPESGGCEAVLAAAVQQAQFVLSKYTATGSKQRE